MEETIRYSFSRKAAHARITRFLSTVRVRFLEEHALSVAARKGARPGLNFGRLRAVRPRASMYMILHGKVSRAQDARCLKRCRDRINELR